jgi:hypothetical protein
VVATSIFDVNFWRLRHAISVSVIDDFRTILALSELAIALPQDRAPQMLAAFAIWAAHLLSPVVRRMWWRLTLEFDLFALAIFKHRPLAESAGWMPQGFPAIGQ